MAEIFITCNSFKRTQNVSRLVHCGCDCVFCLSSFICIVGIQLVVCKHCSATLAPIYPTQLNAMFSKGPFTPNASTLRQLCDNASHIFSLKTMDLFPEWVATHFQVTPLFSMRTVWLASSQSCRSNDTDTWCKWALMLKWLGPMHTERQR